MTVGRTQLIFRLAVIVAKQLQELPYEKRQGNSIARSWINKLTYDIERSTSEACSLLSLLEFVPKTAKELEEEPQIVIQRLEEVRQYCEWLRSSRALVSPSVLDPAVTRVSVVGNVLDLTSPKGTLQKAFIPYQVCYAVPSEISSLTGRNSAPLLPLSTARDSLTALGQKPESTVRLASHQSLPLMPDRACPDGRHRRFVFSALR